MKNLCHQPNPTRHPLQQRTVSSHHGEDQGLAHEEEEVPRVTRWTTMGQLRPCNVREVLMLYLSVCVCHWQNLAWMIRKNTLLV
jgi:hypothetical protein